MSAWVFLKHRTFPFWLANWMGNTNLHGRVCDTPQALRGEMPVVILSSSHGTTASEERTRPRAHTAIILIFYFLLHFSPDFQFSVATNLASCCCLCFLLVVLPVLFPSWHTPLSYFCWCSCKDFSKSQIGSLLFYMDREARNICNWINRDTRFFWVGGELSVYFGFYTTPYALVLEKEMKMKKTDSPDEFSQI